MSDRVTEKHNSFVRLISMTEDVVKVMHEYLDDHKDDHQYIRWYCVLLTMGKILEGLRKLHAEFWEGDP